MSKQSGLSKKFLMIRANMAWTTATLVAERNGETTDVGNDGYAARDRPKVHSKPSSPSWMYAAVVVVGIVQDLT